MHTMRIIEDILCLYFRLGFSNQDILDCLTFIRVRVQNIRSLKRLMRKLGLFRTKHHSDIRDFVLHLIWCYPIAPCNYECIIVGTLFHRGMNWTRGKGYITLRGNSLTQAAKRQASNILSPENFMSTNRSLLYTNGRFYHSKPPRLPLAPIKRVLTIFRLRPVFLSRCCRFDYLHEPANVRVSALNIQLFIGCYRYWHTMSSIKDKYTEAIPS